MKHNTIYRLKRYTLLWIICICIASGNAQASKSPLYFYGAVSVSGDDAVIKLTQDLFFSQLEALDLFDIQDRRQTVYSTDILKQHANTSDLLFYAQIYEKKRRMGIRFTLGGSGDGQRSGNRKTIRRLL